MSVGFGGEAKVWRFIDGIWKNVGVIPAEKKAGELWAIALDEEGKFLVGTTYDGRVNVWELLSETDEKSGSEKVKVNSFANWETRGGFGLAVDVVSFKRFFSLVCLRQHFLCLIMPECTADGSPVTRQYSDGDLSPHGQYLRLSYLNDPPPSFSANPIACCQDNPLLSWIYAPRSRRRLDSHYPLRCKIWRSCGTTSRS